MLDLVGGGKRVVGCVTVGVLPLLDWATLTVCGSSDYAVRLLGLITGLSDQAFRPLRLLLPLIRNASHVRIESPDRVSVMLVELCDLVSVVIKFISFFPSASSPQVAFSLSSRGGIFRLIPL